MADNRGCSLGAVGLAFGPEDWRGPRWRCCWRRNRVASHGSRCEGTRAEPKSRFRNWPIRPTRSWTRRWTRGSEFIKDTQAVVTEAVEAGRTAMQRERERLSG